MATREPDLIDAVGIIRDRHFAMTVDARQAAEDARAAGRSQVRALMAGAVERARVLDTLPSLPDNDWLADMIRVGRGEPSQLTCPLPERPA